MTPSSRIHHHMHAARAQCGFTLIELLVAVLVLSIGLLGVASLQVTGLRQGKGGVQAAEATALAYSLADLMRANKAGASGYIVNTTTSRPTKPGKDCNAVSCSELEMAAFDLYYWLYNQTYTDATGRTATTYGLFAALGEGSAQAIVRCKDTVCTATSVYDIAVLWDQKRNRDDGGVPTGTACADPGGANSSVTDDKNQLACVVISVQL